MTSIYIVTALIVVILTILFYYFQNKSNYWKRKNIPFVKPVPILGNYAEHILQFKTIGDIVGSLCKKMQNEPIFGAFYGTKPVLIAQDPEMIKLITTKDFYFFNGREASDYANHEPMGRNLFFNHGDMWKILRQNLTPIFSAAKMKNMFHLIEKCSITLEDMMRRETQKSNDLDVKSLMARYTMDCICSCVFGIEGNVMSEENVTKNPFRLAADLIFDYTRLRFALAKVRAIWPGLFYACGFKMFSDNMIKFFSNVLHGVIQERKGITSSRQDFVDLLIVLKNSKYMTGDRLTNPKEKNGEKITLEVDHELLVSQCSQFFGAGFETSATALTLTLFELAKAKECQVRVQEEVDAYLKQRGGVVEYDCVNEMPYLEQCVNETMRLYPALEVITREVRDMYTLPNGVQIEKGTYVHLPIMFLHRSPEHFSDPDSYRPERFSVEERHKIKPFTYMPFGEGGRMCLGMRFARMMMMPALITILKKYDIELGAGMRTEVELEPKSLVTTTKHSINLTLVERKR